MQWLLKLIGFNPVGQLVDGLNRAHESRLKADNDEDRLVLDGTIKQLETSLALYSQQADVIKTAMGNWLFWIPWSIAAISASVWFAWGVLDSTLYDGTLLPDVSQLPPQIEKYFDIVWGNIFYTGAGVASATVIGKSVNTLANAIRGKR